MSLPLIILYEILQKFPTNKIDVEKLLDLYRYVEKRGNKLINEKCTDFYELLR